MTKTLNSFWTLVGSDRNGSLYTYEHRMPHGTLVLTVSTIGDGSSMSMAFVPAAPHPGQERP